MTTPTDTLALAVQMARETQDAIRHARKTQPTRAYDMLDVAVQQALALVYTLEKAETQRAEATATLLGNGAVE